MSQPLEVPNKAGLHTTVIPFLLPHELFHCIATSSEWQAWAVLRMVILHPNFCLLPQVFKKGLAFCGKSAPASFRGQ